MCFQAPQSELFSFSTSDTQGAAGDIWTNHSKGQVSEAAATKESSEGRTRRAVFWDTFAVLSSLHLTSFGPLHSAACLMKKIDIRLSIYCVRILLDLSKFNKYKYVLL